MSMCSTTIAFAQVDSQPLELLRAEENYAFFQNDNIKQHKLLEKLKYIPLSASGEIFLSVGANLRQQYELFSNSSWGAGAQDNSGWWLHRYMLHAGLHAGKNIRIFGQLKSGLRLLTDLPDQPPFVDYLDLHQAFVEVNHYPVTGKQVSLRVGRQELWYGSRRLISIREGPNVRRSFDVLKGIYQKQNLQIDAFFARAVGSPIGVFDDEGLDDELLWSIYSVWNFSRLNLDAYYIGFRKEEALFDEGLADELRHSLGLRFWKPAGNFTYNNEVVYQLGSFGSGTISAYTLSVELGYQLPGRYKPALGLRTEVISGDRNRGDGDLNTFNPLYPRGAYFGLISLINPLNLIDVHPLVNFSLGNGVSLMVDWDIFWRMQKEDGVYIPNVELARSGQDTQQRFLGHQPGFEIAWRISRYTDLAFEGSYFITGDFFRESRGPAENVLHFAITSQFNF